MRHIEPTLTRAELWLLETVVETQERMWALPGPSLETLNKPDGHGLEEEVLVRVLLEMFTRRWIWARRRNRRKRFFPAEAEEVEDLLRDPFDETYREVKRNGTLEQRWQAYIHATRNECYYGLTQEGARIWEAFAAPQWKHYIMVDVPGVDPATSLTKGSITCATKHHMERCFESVAPLLDERSIVWKRLKQWRVTYWKRLGMAHRVTFRVERNPPMTPSSDGALYGRWGVSEWQRFSAALGNAFTPSAIVSYILLDWQELFRRRWCRWR